MQEQTSAVFEQVMAQCARGSFTGLLRVHTREGNGEIRFLSGIQDGVRFDSVEGDAALLRLQEASDAEFEAIASLPPIDHVSTKPVPPEGGLHEFHAAQLMRYCESNSLTCALELEVSGKLLTARYRLGELLSVEPDSELTARLAEAKQGKYRFRLPRFELPAHVPQRRAVPRESAQPTPASVAARVPAPAVAEPRAAASLRTPPVAAPAAPKPAPVAAPVAAARPAVTPPASPPPVAARPAVAAPAAASGSGKIAPSAVIATGVKAPEPKAPAAAPPAAAARAVPAVQTPAAVKPPAVAAAPVVPAAAARSPLPAAPTSAPVSSGVAAKPPLQGLWADAVTPPSQAAPLDIAPAPRPHSGSSLAAAPAAAPAAARRSQREPTPAPVQVPRRPRYWLALVIVAVIAALGWMASGGRPPWQ